MRRRLFSLESLLVRIVRGVIRRPRTALAVVLVVVAALTAGMTRLYSDVTNESLFRAGDTVLGQYKAFQARFGRDDAVIAAIDSPDAFSPDFLQRLEAYHRDLEANVPYLDQVTSLVNATAVSDQGGDVLVDELRRIWPQRRADYPAFRERVLHDPLYRNLLVADDGRTVLAIIRASAFADADDAGHPSLKDTVAGWHDRLKAYLAGEDATPAPPADSGGLDLAALPVAIEGFPDSAQRSERVRPLTSHQLKTFIQAVREVTAAHHGEGFAIRLAGSPIIDAAHQDAIHKDLGTLLPLVFVLVLVVLFLVLRRWAGVLLPLAVVGLSLLATLGVMGWTGLPITPVAVALPPLLITIGVVDSVHFLSIFFGEHARGGDREAAILHAVRRTGVPIVFTSLTTIAGFGAFLFAQIKIIADFGLLAAFGTLLALVLTLVLVPSVLVLWRTRAPDSAFNLRWQRQAAWLSRLTDFSLAHAGKVVLVMAVLVAASIPGVMQLRFSHDVLRWFPEDHPVRVDTRAVDALFHGSIPLEVVVDTGRPNGIYSPDVMARLERFGRFAEALQQPAIEMGRTTSVVDTLKRIHAVINDERPARPLPEDERLIAQELLLFESSGVDDVSKLIDSQFSMARITVRLSWADAVDYVPARDALAREAQRLFGDVAQVTVTGTVDLVSRSLVNVIRSMGSSYLIAAVAITLMLIVLARSLTVGLVGMIPNFLPIVITLAIMGYTGYPINMFTVLLGSIALGLAVDDTVHVLHGYRHHRRDRGLDLEASIRHTVADTGPALLFTTVAMTAGFFLFMLSAMDSLFYFGLLLGITLVNALLADMLTVPALLKTLERFGRIAERRSTPPPEAV